MTTRDRPAVGSALFSLIERAARRLVKGREGLTVHQLRDELQALKLQVGRLQTSQMLAARPKTLREAEFRVFSQFGEDGIIQYLLSKVGPVPTTFVEFGVQDYAEANTLFLLLNDNWRGLIIDGSDAAMRAVRQRELYWRHELCALAAFITRDNINDLLRQGNVEGEIGLLSVDIDGNDYWVWERIDAVQPVIVVAEYNAIFGPTEPVSVPYDPSFRRTQAHFSNLYWGCSLAALCHLADTRGYAFVGTNTAGNNAFFVRRDRRADLAELSAEQGYTASRFRESRDESGALTYLSGPRRLEVIARLPVVDVRTGAQRTIGTLTVGS
ncbi:MAG TPA: hypothetical protein VI299_27855 [Polyangiales bacterium]